jgi:hypothetical protein
MTPPWPPTLVRCRLSPHGRRVQQMSGDWSPAPVEARRQELCNQLHLPPRHASGRCKTSPSAVVRPASCRGETPGSCLVSHEEERPEEVRWCVFPDGGSPTAERFWAVGKIVFPKGFRWPDEASATLALAASSIDISSFVASTAASPSIPPPSAQRTRQLQEPLSPSPPAVTSCPSPSPSSPPPWGRSERPTPTSRTSSRGPGATTANETLTT